MDYSILAKSHLFSGLQSDEIRKILDPVPFKVRKFLEGTMIAQSGEVVSSLMIVVSGSVKGEMIDITGRVIKIEDIPAPRAVASAFLFGNKNRFPVNIVAISDGEMLSIGKNDFLGMMMKNNIILANFLDMISNRSQFLSEKIKFLNFKTIKGKLAHYILQKSGMAPVVSLGMTQNNLAYFFGVARPSVARAIGEMEDEGLIEAKGKKIKIVDRQGLADLIHE